MIIQIATLLALFIDGSAGYDIVKNTNNGKVLGTVQVTTGIEEYLGIPFASPPTYNLRWKAPVPYPSWKESGEVWNATYKRSICPQYDETTSTIVGNEDCLFMNLYIPRTPSFELYPVIVYMQPGTFKSDSGNFHDGSLLARLGGVIVVTFNHRLGALGFLNTGDNQAKGNFGLLDQRAVLEWVRDNIYNFQGDPERVTIFGSAAGGVSTLLHAISPQNQNGEKLFHRVISQSGSPFCWWGFQSNPSYYAMKMIHDAGCPEYSSALGIQCLREKKASDIVQWQQLSVDLSNSPWLPSVDGTYITDIPDSMVSDPTLTTSLSSRYDYLLGSTDFETATDYDMIKDIQNRDGFVNYLQWALQGYFTDNDKIADAIAFNYIDSANPPTTDIEWQYLSFDASRDFLYLAPTMNMTYLASSENGYNSSVYYYSFAHKPGQSMVDAGLAYPSADIIDGATHMDDIAYAFGAPLTLPNVTDADRQISIQMMTYWANFAKTGNPSLGDNVDTIWPAYDWSSQRYLQFGNKNASANIFTVAKDHLQSNQVVFWSRELGFFGEGKGIDDSVAQPVINDTQSNSTAPRDPIVTTKLGDVRGLRVIEDGYVVDRFLRIPFAKPPVGFLRFQRTQPHPGWEGTLDATGNRSAVEWLNGCPLFNFVRNGSFGNEDCLFLNIYVPGGIDAVRDQKLPVMVWLFGGAFVWGRGTGLRFYYDMKRLSTQGQVIGVTINYRLGPLGFLSTMDEYAPGNAGLLDQVEALRWVQDNIAAFGGDPGRVTIFGESAGAGSVTMHMVSPLSKDLFLRGIAESGSIPAEWATSQEPLKPAHRLAQSLGCPIDSTKLLVKCLQNKPVDKIVKAGLYNDVGQPKNNAWAAVVDGYFLVDDPINLALESIDKDLLIGHNSMDGFMFSMVDFPGILIDARPMSQDDIVKASSMFAPNIPDPVAEAVAFKYIDWGESNSGLVWPKIAIVDMYTDAMFVVPTYWNINERVAANGTGRTYLYRFSQEARFSRAFPEWKEADHTTEMAYTFGHPFKGRNYDDDDRKLSLAMMTHWTNFAWSGDPNYPNEGDVFTEWPRYDLETKYAVELNTSTASDSERYPSLISNYRGEIVEYWTGHLRDIWNLPLEICETAGASYQSRNWIIYNTETPKAIICPDDPLIRATEGGCIRGYELESNGATTERYLGIPYMKPAVGELRFQPPESADSWADVYPALNFSKICPQESILDDTMSEDCLYLNVYVPQINTTNAAGLPVMVWLHGGGFINGNGMEKLQGDTLAALGGVIVINFNYRIGSFGFMTTDDEFSPGNYGLLDQQFALKWVKNNIANFGGNPDDVTIFGNSAGGQSVLLQSLSPTNKDLGISKAIMESASIIPHDDLKQLDRAISLATEAGCDTTNGNQVMVECLRNLDAANLLSAQARTGLKFEPTVDGQFLPSHPRELADGAEVKNWKYIIGANSGDGSVRWGDVQTVTDEERFHEVVDIWFQQPYGWRKSIPDQHYADYDDLNFFNDEMKMQIHLTEMFGDERYIAPGLEVAEDYTNFGADVYFYFFTYPHDRPDFYGFPSWAGAAHSAEFSFVWGDVINDDTESDEVKDLSRRIIEYWSNFAKTGNPNSGYLSDSTPLIEWKSYKGPPPSLGLGSKNYIQLDAGNKTELKTDLRPTEKTLWVDYMVSQAKYCEVEKPTTAPTSSPPTVDLDSPEVNTTSGAMRGVRIKNDLVDVQAFFGVRYAQPPVYSSRFEKAKPVEDWRPNVWWAGTRRFPCLQRYNGTGLIYGSEDCLYMDIHLPTGLLSRNSTSMPILFWIHGDFADPSLNLGGSFWSGGGSVNYSTIVTTLDPSYLADMGGVVVVSPSFRLGPLGFMTTESDGMEGNYGLSDLKEALLWIHKNAENFAADPNKITVIGQGSGAAAAELLGILPSTRDYVRRVISLSGSSLAPWAFCTDLECQKITRYAANANGCTGTDTEIKTCLQDAAHQNIFLSTPFKPVVPNSDEISNAWGTWRFVRDGDIIPKDVTLEDLFAMSNCDFISGVANNEFFNYIKTAYPAAGSTEGFLQQSIDDTNRFLAYSNVEAWPNETYKVLSHDYTNWDDRYDTELQFQSTVEYYNDAMFAVDSSASMASKSSGYGKQFQYVINRLLQRNDNIVTSSWTGGRHGDDVIYTFGIPFQNPSAYSDEDRQFSLSVMSYWINFAWHGDPNNDLSMQTWPQYSATNQYYLAMNSRIDLPGFPSNYNLEKNSLWSDVVPDFAPENVTTTEAVTTAADVTTAWETTTATICKVEPPPIGTGLGLYLTPEEADTAIYVMFSISLVLGTIIVLVLLHWYCSYKIIKSKNKKTAKNNNVNRTPSWDAYNNVAFDDEKLKEGPISAL